MTPAIEQLSQPEFELFERGDLEIGERMSTELVRQETAAVQHQPDATLLAAIVQAARDPTVDVQKMHALVDLKIKIEQRDAEIEFSRALAEMQPRLPRVSKHGVIRDKQGGVRSRFAKYEDIDAQIRPILAEYGFAFSFDTEIIDGKEYLAGTLAHKSGHKEVKRIRMVVGNSGIMSANQEIGSATSFAKRYLVKMHLNLVEEGEDNDGQGALLTPDQVKTIGGLLTATQSDFDAFLKWANVAEIADIPARKYQECVRAIAQKGRK